MCFVLYVLQLKMRYFCWFLFFFHGREWTGDLRKLPNIKLRKVSNKGLGTKNDGKEDVEEEHKEDKDDCSEEEEEEEEYEDESAQMSDSHWDCNEAFVELPPNWP